MIGHYYTWLIICNVIADKVIQGSVKHIICVTAEVFLLLLLSLPVALQYARGNAGRPHNRETAIRT